MHGEVFFACFSHSRDVLNFVEKKTKVRHSWVQAVWYSVKNLCLYLYHWFLTHQFICFIVCFIWPTFILLCCIWIPESFYSWSRDALWERATNYKLIKTCVQYFCTFPWIHESWYFSCKTFLTWLAQLVAYRRQFSWLSECIDLIFESFLALLYIIRSHPEARTSREQTEEKTAVGKWLYWGMIFKCYFVTIMN